MIHCQISCQCCPGQQTYNFKQTKNCKFETCCKCLCQPLHPCLFPACALCLSLFEKTEDEVCRKGLKKIVDMSHTCACAVSSMEDAKDEPEMEGVEVGVPLGTGLRGCVSSCGFGGSGFGWPVWGCTCSCLYVCIVHMRMCV